MSRDGWGIAIGVGILGVGGLALLAARAAVGRLEASPQPEAGRLAGAPTILVPLERPFSTLDVEAAARMLASENPRGSEELHVEQIWTQLRSKRKRQTLFDRITNGSGWGEQGDRRPGGGLRPVSTVEAATEKFRDLATAVLLGKKPSRLKGARKFFEPAVQDAVFKIAETARQKKRLGKPLDKREQRLINYRKTAADVRRDWLKTSLLLDSIEGVEFYT
jgi:hypothetical protein